MNSPDQRVPGIFNFIFNLSSIYNFHKHLNDLKSCIAIQQVFCRLYLTRSCIFEDSQFLICSSFSKFLLQMRLWQIFLHPSQSKLNDCLVSTCILSYYMVHSIWSMFYGSYYMNHISKNILSTLASSALTTAVCRIVSPLSNNFQGFQNSTCRTLNTQ